MSYLVSEMCTKLHEYNLIELLCACLRGVGLINVKAGITCTAFIEQRKRLSKQQDRTGMDGSWLVRPVNYRLYCMMDGNERAQK